MASESDFPWMAVSNIYQLRLQTKFPSPMTRRVQAFMIGLAEMELETGVYRQLYGGSD